MGKSRYAIKVVSVQFSSVAQSCLTLCDPMDHSPLSSSVHRIFQAWSWCMGMTQRDVMGREVGGGFMFGNTCKN